MGVGVAFCLGFGQFCRQSVYLVGRLQQRLTLLGLAPLGVGQAVAQVRADVITGEQSQLVGKLAQSITDTG